MKEVIVKTMTKLRALCELILDMVSLFLLGLDSYEKFQKATA